MRPNSPPQTTSVSSSRPRCLRSVIRRAEAWSVVLALAADAVGQAAVMVPALVVELDEAHAALGQPAGEQAVGGEGAGLAAPRGRRGRGRSSGSSRIGDLGHARLHAVGHLVLGDAGVDLGVAEVVVVDRVSSAKRSSIFRRLARSMPSGLSGRGPGPCRCGTARPDECWGESRCPRAGRRAAGRSGPCEIRTTNAGRFSLSAPEPVAEPGADARPAGELRAGLEEGDRRVVVDRLGVHRADEAEVVGDSPVSGSNSLIQAPDWPCCANLKIEPASGRVA